LVEEFKNESDGPFVNLDSGDDLPMYDRSSTEG